MFQTLLTTLALSFVVTQPTLASSPINQLDNHVQKLKNNPSELYKFLYKMPKGGELHMHLLGSNYAEKLLSYADNPTLCLNLNDYSVYYNEACAPALQAMHLKEDPGLYNNIIDTWSMRNFVAGEETGHDHFFNSFDKFIVLAEHYLADDLVEVMQRAANQNELYLELILTNESNKVTALADSAGVLPSDSFAIQMKKLYQAGLLDLVTAISQQVRAAEQQARKQLQCNRQKAHPACDLVVRYQYTGLRTLESQHVFALLLAGFELTNSDKQFVGVNLVAPEDDPVALRDYTVHMEQIAFLKAQFPKVSVSLHAGELTADLVPPQHLNDHIQQAITIAGAQRIGHGVSIRDEDNVDTLLAHMRDNHIAAEVNLTSNDEILCVKEGASPFSVYSSHRVPVVLSTDDEGILRTTLTREYTRAVTEQQASYQQLKTISRNSIEYSFLAGASLFADYDKTIPVSVCAEQGQLPAQPSKACAAFLEANDKAAVQWDLEQRFLEFESARLAPF